MELFNTYDIKQLYESANNSFRKYQSRATAVLGLSELHRLCTAEVQKGSGSLETGIKATTA
jgi:hypothetical protein